MIAARRSIRRDNDNPELSSDTLRARFGGKVLLGTGQAGEPDDNGAGLRVTLKGLRRHKDRDFHIAITRIRAVLINGLRPAKHFIFGNWGHLFLFSFKFASFFIFKEP